MQTTVINLYGGPGIGKSTAAAGIFYGLKAKGYKAEIVTEYVKQWAYEGRTPQPLDQFYFFAKQARKEYPLYGKVRYIVTDCPLELSAYYSNQDEALRPAFKEMLKSYRTVQERNNVDIKRFFLKRKESHTYDTTSRYQTEEEAKLVDKELLEFMKNIGDIEEIDADDILKRILEEQN